MKVAASVLLRAIASLILLECTGRVERAAGASIGLFSAEDCSSCNLEIQPGETKTIHIRAITDDFDPVGLVGAGLKVVGLPAGWSAIPNPNPEATVAVGDLFGPDGANIGFSAFVPGTCIDLYSVSVTATTAVNEGRLEVAGVPVWDHTIVCPLIVPGCYSGPCDSIYCVDGGALFINSTTRCTVSVQNTSWSLVKCFYREATR